MSYNEQLRCDYLTTNHEGELAWRMTPEWELYTTVVTMMGVEDKFYESGEVRVRRVADLVRKCSPEFVARLAVYTREQMHLRSVPLLLLVELAQCQRGNSLISRAVARTVQRADEITELLMCYQWRTGRRNLKRLSSQLRKGLAEAFNKFDEYQFAKYNRKGRKVTLRDALVLVHPKPKDNVQSEIFRKILNGTLATPYTWETELSRVGKQHFKSKGDREKAIKHTWQELIASGRMGYMAMLRNLRNMILQGVDNGTIELICSKISNPDEVRKSKQLPFRFLSAYMQLIEGRQARQARQAILTPLKERRSHIQTKLDKLNAGKFSVWDSKVCRYHINKRNLAVTATIKGRLNFRHKTMHARYRFKKTRTFESLKENDLRLKIKLEKMLENLKKSILHAEGNCKEGKILKALENAVRVSSENIGGYDSNTRVLLASDTSGSMMRPISRNSSVMCYHIGLLLSMLMKYRCKSAVSGMFGTIWKVYDMPSDNVLQNTVDMTKLEGEVGYATNGFKVIEWLIKEGIEMDKVMLFTDCQLWDSNSWGGDHSLREYWKQYKEKVAPNARLYIFDLAGYGQSPISMKRDDVFCIAGWSDKVFDILAALERGKSAIDEIRRIAV